MFEFKGKLWKRDAENNTSWFFINLEKPVSDKIRKLVESLPPKRGRNIKVSVRIAWFTRETCIFWDKSHEVYMLPVKLEVRKKLELKEHDNLQIYLDMIVDISTM